MVKKKVLVLTDHMPWGHRAIARAISSYLNTKKETTDFDVAYAEAKMPFSIVNDVYVLMYRYLPSSNRISNKLMEKDSIRKLFLELIDQDGKADIKRILKKEKPDVIVSTYFLHTHALIKLRRRLKLNFKLFTVVADPWTMNPVSFVPEADVNFVYDEKGVAEGVKYGVEKSRLVKTGWWVRPEMYNKDLDEPKSKDAIMKKLGFTDNRPIVFVGGGSLGTNALLKFLPSLLLVKTKVGIVFNTGTDKIVQKAVNQYIRLFKQLRRDDLVQIRNLGWIENMGEVLSICDIVFGKAGPNFLFDVVARQKPFVAITHIGGQEDGNIEIIKRKKLGWVKEKGTSAVRFFLSYLKTPEKYENKYKMSIQAEAQKNALGLENVWKAIEKEIG